MQIFVTGCPSHICTTALSPLQATGYLYIFARSMDWRPQKHWKRLWCSASWLVGWIIIWKRLWGIVSWLVSWRVHLKRLWWSASWLVGWRIIWKRLWGIGHDWLVEESTESVYGGLDHDWLVEESRERVLTLKCDAMTSSSLLFLGCSFSNSRLCGDIV